jgi:HTH-type transcriptional regulator/antitoxin HigA
MRRQTEDSPLRFPTHVGSLTPIENLRFLLDKNGLPASDLGRLLGHRELGSKILKHRRQLTLDHIRKLADRFHVSPATFI